VSALDALARLFACRDRLLERHEQTPWGAVVSDPRFPLIHDANYARVDRDREDLTAEVVERALVPALRASGGRQLHVVMLDPVATSKLLGSFEAEGGETVRDTLMRHDGARTPPPQHPVEEVTTFDDRFWADLRATLSEVEVDDPDLLDRFAEQFVVWQRDVLVPRGQRWFRVRLDGRTAGLASLFERYRRRGVGAAVVLHLVEEARAAGAREVLLLADEPGPIRLYMSLGFRAVAEVVGWQRPMR